jgi:transposase
LEVIPLKYRKAYRATDVKNVHLPALLAGRDRRSVVAGIDVGKGFLLVVLRWSDGRFERPWKVRNPLQIAALTALLKQLAVDHDLLVALEPTGTYADALRQMLHDNGLVVHRVSPKQAHDYAEVFDGVPSAHDGKDAAVLAELAALGKSAEWPFVLGEHDQEMAYWVRRLDVCRRQLASVYGRLEGFLARHFPEATEVLKLSSGTLLRALQHYGGPKDLGSDPRAKERLLDWGGVLLDEEKVERLVQLASVSVGVRQMAADLRWMKDLAGEALQKREQLRQCERQLRKLAKGNEVIQRQAQAVGVATACVLWVKLGNPVNYHCAEAYRKAMGLNLAEYSSGKWQGKKRLSRRGSAMVRRALYFAAMRLVRKTGGNVRRWYELKKKRDEGEAKRALVAVMRKLALALYHVGKGALFETAKVFGLVAEKG